MVEVIKDNFVLRHFNKFTRNVSTPNGPTCLKINNGGFLLNFVDTSQFHFKRLSSLLLPWLAWLLTSWLPWLPSVAMAVLLHYGHLFPHHLTAWCEVVDFKASARRWLSFSVICWTFRYVVQTQGSLSQEWWCDGLWSCCWMKLRWSTIVEHFGVEFCGLFCNALWLL